MSGNGQDVDVVRLYPDLLKACSASPCEVCGGHLPDHEWADLDPAGTVIDCSGETR